MHLQALNFLAGKAPGEAALELNPGRITVFIGPNNGGKSRALRELYEAIAVGSHSTPNHIFRSITVCATPEEIEQKRLVLRLPKKSGEDSNPDIVPYGRRGQRNQVHEPSFTSALFSRDATTRSLISKIILAPYALNLDGQSRLTLINPTSTGRLQEDPTSTLGVLFVNDALRERLSSIIYSAFNYYLVVDPTAMSTFNYALSVSAPTSPTMERTLNAEAIEFYGRTLSVSDASDGTKAFIGIMAEILAGDPEVLFIDEPEAFLHQGLQYALGKEISNNITQDKQIFVATHSPDFLMGCLASGVAVDVVRLTHHAGVPTARLLPATKLKEMMNDPLFRSVGVLSALFYQSAVIVEGGSDRAFYDEINNRLERYSEGSIRHALFLSSYSKQSAAELARPLRDVGVPTALLLDIDWIKEDGLVARRYFEAAGLPVGLHEGKLSERRQVRTYLENADSNFKRSAGVNLLAGGELAAANEFFNTMDRYGLFTVRIGEVESWLSQTGISRNKSTWLTNIFRAMGSDPASPAYLKPQNDDVWAFLRKVSHWVSDANRDGLI